jgi:hypothetical protein
MNEEDGWVEKTHDDIDRLGNFVKNMGIYMCRMLESSCLERMIDDCFSDIDKEQHVVEYFDKATDEIADLSKHLHERVMALMEALVWKKLEEKKP